MKGQLAQRIRSWMQGRLGRFLLTQLAHTGTTAIVLAALFVGAARAGALGALIPSTAATAGSSFTTINYQGRLADSGGNPIDNTNPGLGMTFALYDVETPHCGARPMPMFLYPMVCSACDWAASTL